jgi:hypothetical protein
LRLGGLAIRRLLAVRTRRLRLAVRIGWLLRLAIGVRLWLTVRARWLCGLLGLAVGVHLLLGLLRLTVGTRWLLWWKSR